MKWLTTIGAALLAALALAGTATADLAFEPGSFSARVHDASDADVTQAGAHPNATVAFQFTTALTPLGRRVPSGSVKDIAVELPPGLIGDPLATPRCRHADFMSATCARNTMVGVETLRTQAFAGLPITATTVPVFNIVPPDGTVARFGFQVASVLVILDMRVRSDGGYNLVAELGDLAAILPVQGSSLTLWGVPADNNGDGPFSFTSGETYGGPGDGPRKPFLTNPSVCGAPPTTTIRASSWQRPDTWIEDAYTAASGVTGCDQLRFRPALDLRPESPRAGVPSAYEVAVSVPQKSSPDGLATPPVRDVAVTLPEGVAISPSASDGLQGCTDAQVGLRSLAEAACPAGSKIGTVSIETPVLPDPMTGTIFLGQPKSMDAQTGEMLRTFVVASGHGVTVKLEGRITPDPVTGRIRAVFADNPQLPFSLLRLRFQGGSHAPLTNPPACGTFTTAATITSWGGQSTISESSFEVTQDANGNRPCVPAGFAPAFSAGTASTTAGAFAPFTLTFGRDDAQQDLGDLTVDLPTGLTGLIASAVLCPEAGAAIGSCGESSQIGTAAVAAGPGANPFQLPGRVYITGPYKGAPFGMSIVVPVLAGPFDLGTVVVRTAIHVDRRTAALRVVSDPLPTILQGIPLRIRTVTVAIDRPGFMLNPTSCEEKRIAGTLRSAQGAVAQVGSRFQVGGCAALPYRPRLSLRVGRRGRTRAEVVTPLTATLTMPRGQANNRSISVKLPRILNARLEAINRACTLREFEAGTCTSQAGTASAVTPLLRDPLRGPAYFVRNPARKLPDLMVALRGQVAIDLVGKVTIPKDLTLRTEFDTIPDVPITQFRLSLVDDARGPIGTVSGLCRASARRDSFGQVDFRAHNGRFVRSRQRIGVVGCGKKAKPKAAKPKPERAR